MKKLLIILLLFIFAGCTKNTSNTPVNSEEILVKGFCSYIEIIRIGNHQYIKYHDGYQGSICHYEDCDYCKQHRGY